MSSDELQVSSIAIPNREFNACLPAPLEAPENEESSPFFVVTIFCFVIDTCFFLYDVLFLEGADDYLLDVFLTFLPVLDCLGDFADSDANPNKDCNACLPASVTEFENEESSL